MANLVVLAFKTETGAEMIREKMFDMQKRELVKLDDAAVVVRRQDGKVKVKQATSLVGAGVLGGSFWGLLIGLLFWAPWLGLAIGAAAGGLLGKKADIGVDDNFIKEVGNTIQPGNSALFLLIRNATVDKMIDELRSYDLTVLQTSLSAEAEAKLKAELGADDVVA